MRIANVSLLILMLLAAGCSSGLHLGRHISGPPPAPVESNSDLRDASELPKIAPSQRRLPYRIGPLDQITVLVVNRADLGSQVPAGGADLRRVSTVDENGSIALPLLGRFEVAGRTVVEVRQLVQDKYSKIANLPQVDVEMVAYRSQSVNLEGEFGRPGKVYLSDAQLTAAEVLTATGGLTPQADTKRGLLIRGGKVYRLDYRAAEQGKSDVQDIILQDGDKISFPSVSDRMVYVFGEVGQQGAFPIPAKGMTVLEALAKAQGPNVITAKKRSIYLVRPSGVRDSTVYRMRLGSLLKGDVAVKEGDRLYLPASALTSWQRRLSQLAPFASIAASIAIIIRESTD